MFSLFLLLTTVSIVFLTYLLQRARKSVPGPWGLPLVGYYPFMGENPFVKLQQLSNKYGDIMKISLLNEDYYFLNSLEIVKEAFAKRGEEFSDRPEQFTFWTVFLTENAITTLNGHAWKANRKHILSKMSALGMGKIEIESRINEACEHLCNNIAKKEGNAFNVHEFLETFSANVISAMIFSQIFEHSDQSYIKLRKSCENFNVACNYLNGVLYGNLFHAFKLIESEKYELLRKARKEIYDFLKDIVNKRIAENRNQMGECRDLLDFYLSAIKEKKDHFDVEKMLNTFLTMFVAGTDVISMTLYFGICLMALNERIQRRVQSEIDSVIDRANKVSLYDKKFLNYTNAVIAEIQRYACVLPLGIAHSTRKKVTIEGYEIEKGSKLLANIWKLSRDKRFFSTPDQFNPEHFLDANGQFVKKEANAPFSLGKRRCMGAKLAEVELFISFVSLMQKFNWSPPIDEKIEFRVLEGFARVLKSYKVRANLRF